MTTVVGVDACRKGWVSIVLKSNRPPSAYWLEAIDCVSQVAADASVIAIDIPISLLDKAPDSPASPSSAPTHLALRRRGVNRSWVVVAGAPA